MIASLVCGLLSFAPVDEASKSELLALAKKLDAAQSYHFEFTSTSSRDGAKEGGEADAGGKAHEGEPWQVDFQHGKPAHFKRAEQELWRGEKKLAIHDPKSGKWVGMDRNSAGGAAAEGGEKGEKGEKGRGMMTRMMSDVERVLFPHVFTKDLAKKLGEVTKSGDGGSATYVAALNKDVARELASMKEERAGRRESGRPGREGGKGGKGGKAGGGGKEGKEGGKEGGKEDDDKEGGGGFSAMALQDDGGKGAAKPASEPEIEGNVTFTTANGAITAVDVEITVKAQATRTVRKTMKLSGLDATTLEVPADVTTALGQS